MLAHFQRLFGRNNRDVLLENEGKTHEGGCVKELISSTCKLPSLWWPIAVSLKKNNEKIKNNKVKNENKKIEKMKKYYSEKNPTKISWP